MTMNKVFNLIEEIPEPDNPAYFHVISLISYKKT